MKKRAYVLIEGYVQGVFFRSYTREKASELGLTGWVRNLPDGRVEALFEGDEDEIKWMIAWCHKGPPSAHVTNVQVTWDEYQGEFNSFDIKY